MIARAKRAMCETAQVYGDFRGMRVTVDISPDQKWKVKKSEGYYWLTRKGGMKLRLTETALCRLFELEDA